MNKLIQDSHDAWAKEAIALRAENAALKQRIEGFESESDDLYVSLRRRIEQLKSDNASLLECLDGMRYQYEYGVMVTATENIKMIRECIAKLGGERDE